MAVSAVETYQPALGARAAALGQIFSSSVNDSTSLWYNPAGIARPEAASAEFSISYSLNQRKDSGDEWQSLSNEIKYVGAYKRLSNLRTFNQSTFSKYFRKLSVGAAYMTPYELNFDSTSARNLLDDTAVGNINIKYQQVSFGAGYSVSNKLSLGISADYLMTGVSCLKEAPCVTDGPAGFGVSGGLVIGPYNFQYFDASVALAFRSPIHLNYDSYFKDSVTHRIHDSIPGRPRVLSFGTQAQFTIIPRLSSSINLGIEEVQWISPNSDNAAFNASVNPYRRVGVSAELISLFIRNLGISLRGAVTRVIADENDLSRSWQVAAGGGLQIMDRHFVDLAMERRRVTNTGVSWSPWLVNMSYSFQY